jgi:mannosyltransferase
VNGPRALLGLALLLGLGLRLSGLGRESLWLDEGFSRTMARLDVPELVAYARTADRNPPLYGLVLHVWVGVFGDGEEALRLPSVLFGVLAIAALYAVGRRLGGEEAAALAALLLAVSPLHVAYAQEARSEALTALLALLSMGCFLDVLAGPSRRAALGYVLWSALLLYAHTYGAFIVLAQGLHVVGVRREALKRWLGLAGAVGLLFLPWLGPELEQVRLVRQGFWLAAPSLSTLGASFEAFAGSRLLLLWFGLLGAAALARRGEGRALLLLWMLVPVLVPFGLSQVGPAVYHTRYALAASLPLVLLAAQGLARLRPAALRLAGGLLLIGISLTAIARDRETPRKEQWREAAALLDAEARPGDLALFDAGFCLRHVFSVYARRQDYETRPVEAGALDEPDRLSQGRDRVWVVYSHRRDHEGRILEALRRKGLVEDLHRNLVGIEVYRYARAP